MTLLPEHTIIDFHTHVFPDDVAAKAMPRMEERAGVKAFFDGTVRGLLDSMAASGVHASVIQPVATKPEQTASINQWHLQLRELPGIVPFGALHPDLNPDELDQQIAFLKTNGFPGIKLHPDYQRFHPDEDRLEPFYRKLAQAGLIVLFHAGIDLGLYPPLMAGPERIAQVQKAFPDLTLVAAHMGGFKMWKDVERHLVGTPIWFDTAYCALDCPVEQFRELVQAHGYRKILFASDGPWGGQAENLAFVRRAGLAPEELRAIEGENARALLTANQKLKHQGTQTPSQNV